MSVAKKLEDPVQSLIAQSWEELGYRIRPSRFKVFIRTEPIPQKTESGLLWLPPVRADFYGGLAHQRIVTATVLSIGRGIKRLQIGDRIVFTRLYFARHVALKDGTFLGWMDEEQCLGFPAD